LERVITRVENGQGTQDDVTVLGDAARHMAGRTICALAEGAAAPVLSLLKHFPEDVQAYLGENA